MRLVIYLPREGTPACRRIARGSGVVGTLDAATRLVTIDFEGNIHGAQSLGTFAERLASASRRHLNRAPTVERLAVKAEELWAVGYYDTESGAVEWLDDLAELSGMWWVESPNLAPEKEAASSLHIYHTRGRRLLCGREPEEVIVRSGSVVTVTGLLVARLNKSRSLLGARLCPECVRAEAAGAAEFSRAGRGAEAGAGAGAKS